MENYGRERERGRRREGGREGERESSTSLCVLQTRHTYSEVQLNAIFYKGILCLCWINLMNIMMYIDSINIDVW